MVKPDRSGRNCLNVHPCAFPHLHEHTFPEVFFKLCDRVFDRLLLFFPFFPFYFQYCILLACYKITPGQYANNCSIKRITQYGGLVNRKSNICSKIGIMEIISEWDAVYGGFSISGAFFRMRGMHLEKTGGVAVRRTVPVLKPVFL